ncbi:isoamylase early set domain-containing protein [Psychrosphaera ytuae]|uniref:Isoamylase early set domain-containing protein n=1 Tax=Psychrosphaera ytuae TaxID=2820710 RepID=A0A975DD59_9GAMM|nr:isoamylase early set domain-containing protein [Psychrosphaera ytuae]QTH64181.1 isoamylase early set domain-containing protein [Psychrosphaera ytuae]
MSLKKQYLKSKPICKVTFRCAKNEAQGAHSAEVLGEFNNWTPTPMKRLKSGDFTLTVALEKGKQYQFRYLLDGEQWENDWEADAYLPSPLSYEDNSVVAV